MPPFIPLPSQQTTRKTTTIAAAAGSLLLLASLLLTLGTPAEARYLLVGLPLSFSPDYSWAPDFDYNAWAQENPLYVGDVVIFRYPANTEVVGQVSTLKKWESCNFKSAIIFGNDTAGVSPGLPYTVTKEPAYFVADVTDCEEFTQKVIIQGTLGPLPANPQSAPSEIKNPFLPAPPASPSPPPPPPLFKGLLYRIFSTSKGKQFSKFYALLSPFAEELEKNASRGIPVTVLAPSNAAIVEYTDAIEVALSLMPTPETKSFFMKKLLLFHISSTYFTKGSIPSLGSAIPSLIGAPIGHSKPMKFGRATLTSPDLHLAKGILQQSHISVQGIDAVIFPSDLAALIPKDLLAKLKYGSDPAITRVKITPSIRDELQVELPQSALFAISDQFPSFVSLVNGTSLGTNMWPFLASLGGATVLAPDNTAFRRHSWVITSGLAQSILKPASFKRWLRNVVLFNTLRTFKTSADWLQTTSFTATPTALPKTVLFFKFDSGIQTFFADKEIPQIKASVDNYPDLQAEGDVLLSIQGTDRVLLPKDKAALVPASALPIKKNM